MFRPSGFEQLQALARLTEWYCRLKKQGIRLADDETDEKHDVRSLAPSEATLVAYPHEKTATFKDDKQMAMA